MQRMFRGGSYPGDRLIGSTIAGIDITLWDIKGKALGMLVYERLAGRCREYVQCFLPLNWLPAQKRHEPDLVADATDLDGTVELAKHSLASSHRCFRRSPRVDGIFSSHGRLRCCWPDWVRRMRRSTAQWS